MDVPSIDGPVYIVMEFAHYGNLKDYLEGCRADLLQRNVSIHVATDKGKALFDTVTQARK